MALDLDAWIKERERFLEYMITSVANIDEAHKTQALAKLDLLNELSLLLMSHSVQEENEPSEG